MTNLKINRRWTRTLVTTLAVFLIVGIGLIGVPAQNYNYSQIEIPNSLGAVAYGINAGGDIVGTYVDTDFVQHGFLIRKGVFSTIDYPGADGTDVRGIGPSGEVVGIYWNNDEPLVATHGFLMTAKQEFVPLEYPGHLYTIPQRILPNGTILGCRHDENMTSTMRGIVLSPFGNSEIDLYASMHNGATPDLSRIVGLYGNLAAGRTEGYIIDNGVFSPLLFPGSTMTAAWDVNQDGQVVGAYRSAPPSPQFRGFLYADGEFTTILFPGSTETRAFGINARGDIVGRYVSGGVSYAFFARRGSKN